MSIGEMASLYSQATRAVHRFPQGLRAKSKSTRKFLSGEARECNELGETPVAIPTCPRVATPLWPWHFKGDRSMATRPMNRTILSVEALEDRWMLDGNGAVPPFIPPLCGQPGQNPPQCPPQNPGQGPAQNPQPVAQAHHIDVVVVWFTLGGTRYTAEYEGKDGTLNNVSQLDHLTHWITDGHGGWIATGTKEKAPPAAIPRSITLFDVGAGPVTIENLKITKVEVQYDDGTTMAEYDRKGMLFQVTQGRALWTQVHGKKGLAHWQKRIRPHGPKTSEAPPDWIDREIDANDE
jgi:hypothetical protein